jgi:[acyl-carrier-protein] S-malonyltransferase
MQEAVPVGVGAMAAVLGLDAGKVVAICAEVTGSFSADSGELVQAANFNEPAQTVIAGTKSAVERACEALKAGGARRALSLPVSAPFHSSLMRPAAEKLREVLASVEMKVPSVALVNNVDVLFEREVPRIRDALYRQAFGPVRWVECVQAIKARGVTVIVECGPGKVLAGMVPRIHASMAGLSLHDPSSLVSVEAAIQDSAT